MAESKIEKKERIFLKKIKKNPWIISTAVLIVLSAVLLVLVLRGGSTTGSINENAIGNKAVEFINNDLLQGQGSVTLDSIAQEGGLYKVTVNYNGNKVPAYFTKDGKYFVGTQIFPTTGNVINENTETSTPKEVIKSDKPKVELFVMTHCPFGTQAEKGIIPAMKELGNKIDFKIRFVHYFMHGDEEEQETYRQLCIREEQSVKFIPYVECFLEDGNSSRCIKKAGVNEAAVNLCLNSKAETYYAEDSELSQGYGVQGSPTLIINGGEADFYPRSPSNALSVICSAFNNIPSECSAQLSNANPDPGFGTGSTSGTPASAGSC